MTDLELSKDADANESLADFQQSAKRVRGKLRDAGIDFEEIYAPSFTVRCGTRTTTFRPQKTTIGYYFIAPGKSLLVDYGVMTDADILQVAAQYFRHATK